MIINAAIQLLPIGAKEDKYGIIDKAISLINNSGLNYKVCPFETVVEGSSDKVYQLIRQIQDSSITENCPEVLINIKIHAASRDLHFSEKLEKY
ncbi:MAG: thiamine-binding protein [Bacteroidia bacterium]|nr:thiamine-binding protein [Bacteroidia bacterium]